MSCETTNRSGSHDCGVPVGWKPDVVSCRYIHAHAATTAVSRATSLLAARMRLCQRRASAATRLDMCRVTAPRRRRRAAGGTNATAAVRRATSRACVPRVPVLRRAAFAAAHATTVAAWAISRVTAHRPLAPLPPQAPSATTAVTKATSRVIVHSRHSAHATHVARASTWRRIALRPFNFALGAISFTLAQENIARECMVVAALFARPCP